MKKLFRKTISLMMISAMLFTAEGFNSFAAETKNATETVAVSEESSQTESATADSSSVTTDETTSTSTADSSSGAIVDDSEEETEDDETVKTWDSDHINTEEEDDSEKLPLDEITEEMTGGDPEWFKANGYPEAYADVDNDEVESEELLIETEELNGGLSSYGGYDVPTQYASYRVATGIDVSKYQKTIDWAAAKADGVEFAIVRIGYRSYGDGSINEDQYRDANIKGAYEAGVKVGIYFFSQAISVAEAAEEANYAAKIRAQYSSYISLPTFMDYEYVDGGRLKNAGLSKSKMTTIAQEFCTTTQVAGYIPGIYGNKSFLTSSIDGATLGGDYYMWVAHYTNGSVTTYAGEYSYWQCSRDGVIKGVPSDTVDLDYWYAKGHKITCKNCGSEYGTITNLPTTCYEGWECTLKKPKTSSTTYSFEGWYSDSAKTKKITTIDAWNYSDVTIYAKWGMKVTLDLQGGVADCEELCVDPSDDKPYASLPTPVRAGYTFNGWYADDGKTVITKDTTTLYSKSAHTLTAKWTLSRTMTAPVTSVTTGSTVDFGTEIAITSSIANTTIYYTMTTDGTEPATPVTANTATSTSPASDIYCEPIQLNKSGTVKIKAIATKDAYADSSVLSLTYTVKEETESQGDIEDSDVSYRANNLWTSNVATQTYTGSKITPAVTVYYGNQKLTLGTDYTLTYKNNIKAGTASIVVKGKGNYSGSFIKNFVIAPKDMTTEFAAIGEVVANYTGKAQSPTVTVYNGTKKLAAKTDYTLSWTNDNGDDSKGCTASGNYIVTIEGNGNYTGSATFNFKILKSGLVRATDFTVSKIANQSYTRSAIKPEVKVKYKGKELTLGTDYSVTYDENGAPSSIGTHTIIITALGDTYYGTKLVTYNIVSVAMSKVKVTGIPTTAVGQYKGGAYTISGYTLTYGDEQLKEGTDYTAECSNNVNAGSKAVITFTGCNKKFTGVIKKTFKIASFDMKTNESTRLAVSFANSLGTVTVAGTNYDSVRYTKSAATPTVTVTFKNSNGSTDTLKQGTDYTVKYSNNTKCVDLNATSNPTVATVKITGKGNYTGTFTKEFVVRESNISNLSSTATAADIVLNTSKVKNYITTATVVDTNGKKLVAGTDYKITKYLYTEETAIFADDKATLAAAGNAASSTDMLTSAATMTAVLEGIGKYEGTLNLTYNIYAKKISAAKATIAAQEYTGKAVTLRHNQITLVYGSGKNAVTLANSDYEIVSYSNNTNKGTASVTIRGLHDYGGTKTINFKITDKTVSYTITYDKNDSEATGTMKTAVVASGAKLAAVAYKKDGYAFASWNTEADGSGVSYANKAAFYQNQALFEAGSAITLYAQWKPVEYKITYYLNGGTNPDSAPTTHNCTANVTLPTPTKPGYVFDGWYYDSKFTDSAGTTIDKAEKAVKRYAKWVEDTSTNHDLFVSSKGNDSNAGTADHPFKTIQKALDTVKAGQTIYLRKGTYTGTVEFNKSVNKELENTSATRMITLTCFPGEKAVLNTKSGTNGAVISLNGCAYVNITNLYITGVTGEQVCGIKLSGGENNVKISGNDISKIKTTKTDSTATANGILLYGETAISNVTIDGNSVHDNTNGYAENISVAGNCSNITVSNNKVYNNTNIGIDFCGNYGYCSDASVDMPRDCSATGNTVYNCVSKIASCAGIYVDGAKDITISGNTVYKNQYGIEIGAEKNSTYQVSGIKILNNTIYSNLFEGIRIGGYTSDNTTGTVTDVTVSDNTIKNDFTSSKTEGYEINLCKCSTVTVTGNRFYMKNNAFKIINYEFEGNYPTSLTMNSNYKNGTSFNGTEL